VDAVQLGQPAVRNRRLRIAARIAIGVLAVVLLAAALFVLANRNVTTPVTKDDALRRFRATRSHEEPSTETTVPRAAAVETTTTVLVGPAGASRPSKQASAVPGGKASAPAGVRPADISGPYTLPAEGVYSYHASGGDSVSLAGASHSYPSEVYDTVTHVDGCLWKSEFDIAKENEAFRTLCSEPGRLSLLEDRREITYFGQKESEDPRCHPPVVFHDVTEQPGSTTSTVCDSSDTHVEVQATYLGHDMVAVGGAPVDGVHLKFHGTLSGRARGTADEQLWVLPQTGLVLRWDRLEDADGNAIFGANIHYHEKATFVLESLTPST
jgi:hypothetical protein